MPIKSIRSLYQARPCFDAAASAGDSTAATAFLARTSGLDGTHTNAYKALLNGLTTDGLFNSDGTSNYFDALYVYATADATTSLLNLCRATYNSTNAASSTFTADSGYAGGGLNTAFDATTATSPNFVQNSAHLALWNLTNITTSVSTMGNSATGVSGESNLFIKLTADNNFYARLNDAGAGGVAISDPRGLLIGTRTSSSNIDHYLNGASLGAVTNSSSAPAAGSLNVMRAGAGTSDTVHTIAAASIGGALNSTQAAAYYSRMRTYMTAVGVP